MKSKVHIPAKEYGERSDHAAKLVAAAGIDLFSDKLTGVVEL